MLALKSATRISSSSKTYLLAILQSKMSGLPFDRKAMEEERLARVAARKKRVRSISPPPSRDSRKAPKLEEESTTLASGAKLNFIYLPAAGSSQHDSQPVLQSEMKRERVEQDPVIKYPHGIVRRTWAFNHDRVNDVKIEEVLEPLTLRTAVMSSFQWDPDWVFSKLRTPLRGGETKCVFVMEAKDPRLRQQILEDIEDKSHFLRVCFPPMDGAWCMHSKLMLLFHPTKLRVAVPTANLLNFDWGETGVMENSVFMVDLPRLPKTVTQGKEQLTCFGKELLLFIERQGLDQDVREGVLRFDFSATANMAFLHSIGGTSYDEDASRTGLRGLSSAVRSLGLETTKELEIDFAASSIGSLKDEFLQSLHASARGLDLAVQQHKSSTQSKKTFFDKASAKLREEPTDIRKSIRIYFPTHETVRASRAGGAGTICLQRNWFESATFPRSIFRDYISTRSGLLSHNKILCARGPRYNHEAGRSKTVAWVYVGSANASMSAWGTVPKSGKDRMTCRNWECGALLPVPPSRLENEHPAEIKEEHDDNAETPADQIRSLKPVTQESHKPAITKHDESETESDDDAEDNSRTRKTIAQVIHGDDSETESDDASENVQAVPRDVTIKTEVKEESASTGSLSQQRTRTRVSSAVTTSKAEASSKKACSLPSMHVFEGLIDLPFTYPGSEYQGREPWYFDPRSKGRED